MTRPGDETLPVLDPPPHTPISEIAQKLHIAIERLPGAAYVYDDADEDLVIYENVAPEPPTVLMEPFNDFTTNPGWTPGSATIVAGRTGTAANITGSGLAVAVYTIPTLSESADLTLGFAHRVSNIASGIRAIGEIRSSTTTHLYLRVTTSGALEVRLGASAGPLIGTTPTGVLVVNVYAYIEIKATLGDAPNGAVTVRVNEVEHIAVTGVDTRNAGPKAVFDNVALAGPGAGVNNRFDDLYLTMGAGALFKGDITIP